MRVMFCFAVLLLLTACHPDTSVYVGVVVGKGYTASESSVMMIVDGKGNTQVYPVETPETYTLLVRGVGGAWPVAVTQEVWLACDKDDGVRMTRDWNGEYQVVACIKGEGLPQ